MRVEDVTPETTRPVRRPWLVQSWHDLTFVHWPVDPAVVAPLLPRGTEPDLLDGVAYAGLIAFRMVRLGFRRGLPYLGTFCETNVRLYSVDNQGRRAVVFRSLDAERLLPVIGARVALRLPYRWARMRLHRDGDVISYTSRRRGAVRARSALSARIGALLAAPSPLDDFLTARWGLHTRAWGRTLHLPNDHPRWPLHAATLLSVEDELVTAAGLPAPAGPPASVLYSPGVPVVFGAPSVVREVRAAGAAERRR